MNHYDRLTQHVFIYGLYIEQEQDSDAVAARIRLGQSLYWQAGAACNVEEKKCGLCTE